MKKLIFVFVALFLSGHAFADTLELKSGTIVEGLIVERGEDFIRMSVDGVRLTYYSDEIANFEEVVQQKEEYQEPRLTPMQIVESGQMPSVNQLLTSLPTASDIAKLPHLQIPQGTKRELVLKFIVLFGTYDTMRANFAKMSESLSPHQAEAFRRAYSVDAVINLLVPIYEKYFTEEDLREYVTFYGSSAGQRLNVSLSNVMQESVMATMQYFEMNMPPELKEQETTTVSSTATGVPIQLPTPNR